MCYLLLDDPNAKWTDHNPIIDIPYLIINVKPGECERCTCPGAILQRCLVTILFAWKRCRTKRRVLRSLGTSFIDKKFTLSSVQLPRKTKLV